MAPSVRVFKYVVLRDLDKVKIVNARFKPNLELVLQQLCDHKDLVIRLADKEGVSRVLDKEAYIAEITKIWSDRDTYDPGLKYK